MPRQRSLLEMTAAQRDADAAARRDHPDVVGIVHARFSKGISAVFASAFRQERFHAFVAKADPVYAALLGGMDDEDLARDLVEKWMISHTMATQSRFWLEDAIVDVLRHRAISITDVDARPLIYSLSMLRSGWYRSGMTLWNAGEDWKTQLHGRGQWTERIGTGALAEADAIVAEQEAAYDAVLERRSQGHDARILLDPIEDRGHSARVQSALGGAHRATALKCNLLFIVPETATAAGSVTAIRYINPATMTGAAIRDERVNLLRLSAWVHQEKLFRQPGTIRVVAADLVPRSGKEDGQGRAWTYFSEYSRWRGEVLWKYLEVPFSAVRAGIRDAGREAAARLKGSE